MDGQIRETEKKTSPWKRGRQVLTRYNPEYPSAVIEIVSLDAFF